jgi:hypothetical protein
MEYDSVYVYGVIDGNIKENLDVTGIGDREDKVFSVKFKDISAIVSMTPFEEYDPTEENTLAHEGVIQELLKHNVTIAPMRFCTVLRTNDDLYKLLQSGYISFKRNLLRIRHRHEFTLKVFLDLQKLQGEISDNDELVSMSHEIAQKFYTGLKEVTDDAVLSEQVTEEMILNASFLVRKEQREKFQQVVVNFDKDYTDKLKVRISGPTAPYNFVSMPVS